MFVWWDDGTPTPETNLTTTATAGDMGITIVYSASPKAGPEFTRWMKCPRCGTYLDMDIGICPNPDCRWEMEKVAEA